MSPAQNADPSIVVVDTDVMSFWQRADTRGGAYIEALRGQLLVISFQTVAELLRWALQHDWGARRRRELDEELQRFVAVPSSTALARHWAAIMAETSRAGLSMGVADAWVAATARMLDLPVATHNRRHFERVTGLHVINFAPA